jgi:hypothetical protein
MKPVDWYSFGYIGFDFCPLGYEPKRFLDIEIHYRHLNDAHVE